MSSLLAGTRFVQLATGEYRSVALAADGTLYEWGTQGIIYPTALSLSGLPPGTRFTQVSAGLDHGLALAADGTLYAWGDNTLGQLGDGTQYYHPTPIAVDVSGLPAGTRFSQIISGGYHSLALASDGTLYAWGFNGYGSLGTASGTSPYKPSPVRVAGLPAGTLFTALGAGGYQSLALANGLLYAWGRGNYGQRGDNTYAQANAPVQESSRSNNWVEIGTGAAANHSLAIGGGDVVYTAGNNVAGQLGDGTLTNSPVFIRSQTVLPTRMAAAGTGGLNAFPVPAHGLLYVQDAVAATPLILLDALGRLVTTTKVMANGSAVLELPAMLSPGVYLLRNGGSTRRIMVE